MTESGSGGEAKVHSRDESRGRHLGVLFVHGMGEQKQGQTLVEAADAVISWLYGAQRAAGRHLNVRRRNALAADAQTAAHVEVVLDPGAEGESRWLLAEGWWASQFRSPAFFELTTWFLTRGCWVLFSHFAKLASKRTGPAAAVGWVADLLAFVASLMVAVVYQAIVLALAVIGAIPISPLRDSMAGALKAISHALGDAETLVRSPVQSEAAYRSIKKQVEWLRETGRCEKVAVVAHSQGAKMALEAIDRGAEVDLLVTLGSGQLKLDNLQMLELGKPSLFLIAAVTPLAFVGSLVAGFVLGMSVLAWALAGLVFLCSCTLAISARRMWAAFHRNPGLIPSRLGVQRVDYYASEDPVANGPSIADRQLQEAHRAGVPAETVQVFNRRSLTEDHNAYWENMEEFVAHLVGRLGTLASVEAASAWPQSDTRKSRTRDLFARRWLLVIGAFCATVALADAQPEALASTVGNYLSDPDVPDWLRFVAAFPGELLALAAPGHWLPGSDLPRPSVEALGHAWIAMVPVFILSSTLGRVAWSMWAREVFFGGLRAAAVEGGIVRDPILPAPIAQLCGWLSLGPVVAVWVGCEADRTFSYMLMSLGLIALMFGFGALMVGLPPALQPAKPVSEPDGGPRPEAAEPGPSG